MRVVEPSKRIIPKMMQALVLAKNDFSQFATVKKKWTNDFESEKCYIKLFNLFVNIDGANWRKLPQHSLLERYKGYIKRLICTVLRFKLVMKKLNCLTEWWGEENYYICIWFAKLHFFKMHLNKNEMQKKLLDYHQKQCFDSHFTYEHPRGALIC